MNKTIIIAYIFTSMSLISGHQIMLKLWWKNMYHTHREWQ